jgi:hypothetical protein
MKMSSGPNFQMVQIQRRRCRRQKDPRKKWVHLLWLSECAEAEHGQTGCESTSTVA